MAGKMVRSNNISDAGCGAEGISLITVCWEELK
jgi:hypothetical protein